MSVPVPCRLVRVEVEEIDRAITDPSLSGLLAEGWAPLATLAVEERGRAVLVVVLRPPAPPEQAARSVVVAGVEPRLLVAAFATLALLSGLATLALLLGGAP